MTAHEIIPPSPAGTEDGPGDFQYLPSRRHDGWTGERQRLFLEALSQGASVTQACKLVGLTQQSAYAFRRAARGAGFAIGWQAAQMLCGEALADDLMDRARNGTGHIHFAADGTETHYRRHDNQLAFKMLNRADRMANKAGNETSHAAARLVAGDFEQYLDMIGRDCGPARAGLFLGTRLGAQIAPDGQLPAGEDDLAPVRALARADRWLRTHTDLADPLATADLDPATRGDWTAEQWLRAEAAGLLQLAPAPAPAPAREPDVAPEIAKLHQHWVDRENPDNAPVWWSSAADTPQWRTRFPPPEDFDGEEDGEYGDPDYSRELSIDEEDAVEAPYRAGIEAQRAVEAAERDAFFAPDAPVLPEPSAPPKRSDRHTAHPASGSQEFSMSIFGTIKDAIFGHKPAAAPSAPANTIASEPTATAPTPQNQQAAPAPASPVDVEQVLTEKLAAKGNPDLNWRTSIVDLMKLLDLDSSLDNRKELATELGYAGAKDGSAEMNLWLHNAVMLELMNNGAKVPGKLAD